MDKSYKNIAEYYNKAFIEYGDTPEGLAWDNQTNLDKRYEVMFDLIKPKEQSHITNSTLLDFGCGYGGFYKWLKDQTYYPKYTGIDINRMIIEKARKLYPEQPFGVIDIHNDNDWESFNNPVICKESYDYVVLNGVFTVKNTLAQDEMWSFMTSTLEKLWIKTNKGVAFNIMSKMVDWERDDLFHVSFDKLSRWVYNNLSSKFTIRQDYSLREFTAYVYK
jgi:SAM-dependent methyltransferase